MEQYQKSVHFYIILTIATSFDLDCVCELIMLGRLTEKNLLCFVPRDLREFLLPWYPQSIPARRMLTMQTNMHG
jgi:hypothetical protein